MFLRKNHVYGIQHDYFDHHDVVGWTLEGDIGHKNSGLAVLLSDFEAGEKQMYVGKHFAGTTFYDFLGNRSERITIDENGNGVFFVNGGSVSAWVQEV